MTVHIYPQPPVLRLPLNEGVESTHRERISSCRASNAKAPLPKKSTRRELERATDELVLAAALLFVECVVDDVVKRAAADCQRAHWHRACLRN